MDAYFFQGVFTDENTLLKALFFGGKEITYQSWYGVDPSTLELNRTYNPAGEIYDENGKPHPVPKSMLPVRLPENIDLNEQTNINQIETASLEENTDDKVFEQNEVSESVDQIETDYISEEVSNSSSHVEKPNETSVRRLSLFDTLSTENKSEDIAVENDILTKTEPVFASSEEKIEENDSEDNNSEDDNINIDEKEEFSAEESESSEIDDDFNQETEEELLDIPTFLRRQAN